MKQKRKQLKKEGKPQDIPEDQPESVSQNSYIINIAYNSIFSIYIIINVFTVILS